MRIVGGFDHATMADAFSHPGIDPRTHISFGLVHPGDESSPAVEFDSEYGQVFVNVILQPSKLVVRCRVASQVAGSGEGEHFPFLENDEVIVLIPEGDERAGATIIGRMNNSFDTFPTDVAGQDPTKNNFAFRRLRTPYILETASSYMIRSAVTKAFWSIDQSGTLTFSDGNNNMMHVGPDFIGMASGDNKVLLQLDLHANQVVAEADGAKLVLDKTQSVLATQGALSVSTSGQAASGHVITTEAVAALLDGLLTALGVLPVVGTAILTGKVGFVNGAIAAAASGASSPAPYQSAISDGLAAPGSPIGVPGFLV
jgi:hypothetical protein